MFRGQVHEDENHSPWELRRDMLNHRSTPMQPGGILEVNGGVLLLPDSSRAFLVEKERGAWQMTCGEGWV